MKLSPFFFLLLAACLFGCKTGKMVSKTECQHSVVKTKTTDIAGFTSTIKGRVRDIKTGEPIVNAMVRLTRRDGSPMGMQTDAEGSFLFQGLAPTIYGVQIDASDRVYEELDAMIFTFESGKAKVVTLDVQLKEVIIQTEKPVIYLYPTEKTNVRVQLAYDGTLTHTYPSYPNAGWNVTAAPDGTLWDERGQEYYALFWEGLPRTRWTKPTTGFVVRGAETAAFLEEKLAYLGLNRREANEFMMYWLPRMEGNAYNFIHFAGTDYEQLAPLTITPTPETLIRVMMLTQPLPTQITVPAQDLRPLHKLRKGFTAVEWGGSEGQYWKVEAH